MIRYGNLMEQIASMPNIELADERARQNKHKRWGVIKHDKHKIENLHKLQ